MNDPRDPLRRSRLGRRAARVLLALVATALLASCGGDSGPAGPGGQAGSKGWGGAGSKGRGGAGTPEPRVPVIVAPARLADMEAFLDASSTLEAEDTVEVVSQATGVVAEVHVEEGDRVRKGDLLARLAYEELELAERRARSEFERLTAEFERAEKLHREALIPVEQFQSAKFDLAAAEIDWQQRRLELERTRLLAPIGGTVSARMIRLGDLVRENEAVFRIVDFDSLVAPVYIPEKYLGELRVGQRAVLTPPALAGRTVEGRVERISPVVDSQSGTVRVTVDLDRNAALRPGLFANVQLELDRHEDVVVVQKKALVYDDELPQLYLVEDGTARRKTVETGYESGDGVEITRGVVPGDLVVVVGQSALKDGSAVQAEDEEGNPLGPPPGAGDTETADAGPAEPAADGVAERPRGKRPGRRP